MTDTTTTRDIRSTASTEPTPTVEEQATEVLLPLAAGYVGHRTVAMGLRRGLIATLAERPRGMTADELAAALGFDPLYVAVWCRAAEAARVLDRDGERYQLAPHMETLLLDRTAPALAGPTFTLLEQREVFDRLEATLSSGDRAWWDEASPEFIANVAETGRPFYIRLIPEGLGRIPGLAERLAQPCRILDTACGAGVGVLRLARAYPTATVVGADGDAHSLDVAQRRVSEAGLDDRVSFVHTPLEALDLDPEFALVINNISMHECRDIDAVAANVHAALEPGGWFVISDIPFPETVEGLRTVPGRIMSGIQFWEAQIDDQLLPRRVYEELLPRHGIRDVGAFELAPVHAVTYGRA